MKEVTTNYLSVLLYVVTASEMLNSALKDFMAFGSVASRACNAENKVINWSEIIVGSFNQPPVIVN